MMEPGRIVQCLRADNAGPMTGGGTNTYLLFGPEGAVVIDPGPALPAHLAAILQGLAGARLQAVLVSHAHLDHSALAPALAAATGASVFGFGDATAGRSARMQVLAEAGLAGGGEGVDLGFRPDCLVQDGEVLQLAGLRIEALHTPGHMGGHLCFALGDDLFSGDQVMGWSTSLVSPPDGDMTDYMASLARLSGRNWARFLPGHGPEIADPAARLQALIQHRRAREAAILQALGSGAQDAQTLARAIYTDTPATLQLAAARSILAHLIDLHGGKIVTCHSQITLTALFQLN